MGIKNFLPQEPRCSAARTITPTLFAIIIPIQKSELIHTIYNIRVYTFVGLYTTYSKFETPSA
jgi:hypothetical protein